MQLSNRLFIPGFTGQNLCFLSKPPSSSFPFTFFFTERRDVVSEVKRSFSRVSGKISLASLHWESFLHTPHITQKKLSRFLFGLRTTFQSKWAVYKTGRNWRNWSCKACERWESKGGWCQGCSDNMRKRGMSGSGKTLHCI